jgi:hypothetical protein
VRTPGASPDRRDPAADGEHRFFVKAFDAAGNVTKSPSITLVVAH